MDGELVSGLLSENGGGGGNPSPSNLTYAEIFDKHFPFYLSIGMTAHQYWDEDVSLVKAYREAYKMKRREENFSLWLQGRYFYDALCCASPLFRSFSKGKIKPIDYTAKPYDLFSEDRIKSEEEKEKKQQEKLMRGMKAWMLNVNQKFKK